MGVPSRSQLCGHLARPGYLSFVSVGWASWKVAGLELSCWHLLFCSSTFPCKNSCSPDKGSQKQEHVVSLSLRDQRMNGKSKVNPECASHTRMLEEGIPAKNQ